MIKKIENGTITSAQGFFAGATVAGIKSEHHFDLGIVFSESVCKTAGMFTINLVKSSCVVHSQKVVKSGKAQAIVVNSGCANTCTGKQGMADVREMAGLTARKLGINAAHVVVANTGVIGITLPMKKINAGIKNMELTEYSGHDFASAILTTDTIEKEIALSVEDASGKYVIAGVAKGAGMIHPNMATMLCFIITDANVNGKFLQEALKKTVDNSFNMISVDGDTSTNDMVILLSNGLAGNQPINKKNGSVFIEALGTVCEYLAKEIVKDGEGATKFMDVTVEGARSSNDARLIARAITSSSLVKTAIYGNDPNWGRIIAAAGRSGAKIIENRLVLYLNDRCVFKDGRPQKFDEEKLSALMMADTTITIKLNLNSGRGKASAWGCDLSKEYVTINSAYTT